MAENEVALINIESLKDKVSDKIRASFVDLIPEDAWKAMVEKEIKRFITPPKPAYDDKNPLSPLEGLIREELKSIFGAIIKEEFKRPEYVNQWHQNGKSGNDFVKDIIKDNMPQIIQAVVGSMMNDIAVKITNDIRGRY